MKRNIGYWYTALVVTGLATWHTWVCLAAVAVLLTDLVTIVTVSVHFNHFPYMEICDTLRRHILMWMSVH